MLVAAFGWMWSSGRRRPVLGFAERDLVLIGTVENTTSDRVLDGTLATALTISLEQSQYVTLLPPARVRGALLRMRRQPDAILTEDLAREICLREGARALLAGAVTSSGRGFLLTVRIIDPSTGASVGTTTARASSKDGVLDAVDRVASDVRVALGESLPSITKDSRRLAEATTSSLEALRDYTAALGFLAHEQRSEAEALLVRAIELDADFARAYATRAAMYRGYGIVRDTALAERYFQEALERLDHVTERERLEIQALYHGAMGRYEKAAGLYRLLLQRHPAVSEYHYFLGRQYQGLRRFAAAIPEYLEAIRLNPTSSEAFIRLANSYSSAKQHAQARTAWERAFALEPSWETEEIQNHQYGWTLVMVGDEDAARAAFAKMLTAGPFKRARGLRSFGLLALYRGQLSEAKQKLDEARAFNEKDYVLSAARDRLYLAEALLLFGRAGDAIQELDRGALLLERIQQPSAFIYLRYAALYAMAGRTDAASRWLAHGRRYVTNDDAGERADLDRAEGELLLARGERVQALEAMQRANASGNGALTRSSLARVLRSTGRREEARQQYEEIVATDPEPWEGHVIWAVAHLALGELYEETGDVGRARATYAALAKAWEHADSDLPAVRTLRAAQKRIGT
jgi:tetratricopeptide (TPR) repeat protein